MLKSLYIENVLLIEQVEIDFLEGLTAITGQTGAGKSVLLESIGIILGDQAKSSLMKNEDRPSVISATFDISLNENAQSMLLDFGITQANELIIRKILTKNGSKIYLNDTPCTVQFVRSLAPYLMEIHSQFEQMSLMHAKNHLHILDKFAQLESDVHNVKQLFFDYKTEKERMEALHKRIIEQSKNKEFLEDVIEKVGGLNLKNGEIDELESRKKLLVESEKIIYNLKNANEIIGSMDFSRNIYKMQKLLVRAGELTGENELAKEIEKTNSNFEKVEIDFSNANEELESLLGKFNSSENEIDDIEGRLSMINEVARRFSTNSNALLDLYESAKKQYGEIENCDSEMEKMKQIVDEKRHLFMDEAGKLSTKRKENATKLSELVTAKLKLLKMEFARFYVEFDESEPSETGTDHVVFKGNLNPGLKADEIHKIASGGELSRFMLALKTVISKINLSGAIIFDEIDTGVSGDVAFAIGRELRNISRGSQVVCVTHNPQVAACADSHFLVLKEQNQNDTKTKITELDRDGRINAIAYMISGANISQEAISNARSLLDTKYD